MAASAPAPQADTGGIDIAEAQIEAARGQAEALGLADRTVFRVGRAEETGLEDDSVDLVAAGQCWPWFDHDAALGEDQVAADDADLAELLARAFAEEPVHVLHRVWTVVVQRRD